MEGSDAGGTRFIESAAGGEPSSCCSCKLSMVGGRGDCGCRCGPVELMDGPLCGQSGSCGDKAISEVNELDPSVAGISLEGSDRDTVGNFKLLTVGNGKGEGEGEQMRGDEGEDGDDAGGLGDG